MPNGLLRCHLHRSQAVLYPEILWSKEKNMEFLHTFSPWNTHVQMKALTPSRMKPADDRQRVLFQEALREGRRRNPQISPPMNRGESKQKPSLRCKPPEAGRKSMNDPNKQTNIRKSWLNDFAPVKLMAASLAVLVATVTHSFAQSASYDANIKLTLHLDGPNLQI